MKQNKENIELSAAPDDCVKGADVRETPISDELEAISTKIEEGLQELLEGNTGLYKDTEYLPLVNRVISSCICNSNVTEVLIVDYYLDITIPPTVNVLREKILGIKKPFDAVFHVNVELTVNITETKTLELDYPVKIQR